MATKPSPAHKGARGNAGPEDVGAFIDALEHPMKDGIRAIRAIVLGADPSIAEGIKWNAPSFRTVEYFATVHLRAKQGLGVILHFGAKKHPTADAGVTIADPSGLLEWLGKDRALVSFTDLDDIEAKQAAFAALLRAWIAHV